MAQSLNALAVGALVKDTGTLYNGKPIIWKIADKGHTGYPSGAVTLITERIISLKCFDAIESGNSDGNRRSYGNNRWTLSNVRQWLNSQAAAGKWYSAQHGADAPPTNANVWSNYNEYDAEAGFLAGFSANFIAALLTTTHTVGKATVDGGGTESCADKIFLATCTEVGLSGDVTAGSKLALFSNDSSRLAYPTAEAVSKSEYTNSSLNVNSPWWWWLADAYASSSYGVRYVYSSGAMNWYSAYGGNLGVRPLCNLSSGILVSDSPDSDGAYTIIWNRAPSKPSSIAVPSSVRGGESLSISWGASTDEDGNLSGYILERQVNGGAWAQTIFYPMMDASMYGRGTSLLPKIVAGKHDTKHYNDVPDMDAAAVMDDAGNVTIFAVNRDLTEPMVLDLDLRSFGDLRPAMHSVLHHDDMKAENTESAPDVVKPVVLPCPKPGEPLVLPAASWNVIRFVK